MVDKVTAVIGRPTRDVRIRLHIELVKNYKGKEEYFHSEFSFNEKEYLKFDLQSFVTLEYTGGEWSKDKSIMITEKNLFILRKGLKQMVRNCYADDIFVIRNNETVLPSDMEEKYTVKLYDLGMNQRLLLKPTIVSDMDGITYEGVAIYFNNSGNCAAMSITEFEALVDAVDKINLFVYSQQVLSIYLMYIDKLEKVPSQKTENVKQNVFAKDIEEVRYKNTQINKEEFFNMKESE